MNKPLANQDTLDREIGGRKPFINRSTKGKTSRMRNLPAKGVKTNVGDPIDNRRGK
jgi:hypothetical protein